MKKKLLIGLSLFCSVVLNAQEPGDNYLLFEIGGGGHKFLFDASESIIKDNYMGYTLQAGYCHFFSSWGIQTGIGLKTFKSAPTINMQTAEVAIDSINGPFEFRTKYNYWKELEKAVFLTIPLEVKYRIPLGKSWDIIAGLGGELDVTVLKQFSSAGSGSIETTGYYSQWNTEFSDMPNHGFSTQTDIPDGDLPFTTVSFSGIADIGGLYKLNEKNSIYIGSYLGVGLNNIRKSDATAPVYQIDGTYNGICSSSDIKTIKPLSLGLKIGYYFNMTK